MIATEPQVFDPNAVQHRAFKLKNLEIRSSEDGEPPMIRGYAAVFNTWADIIPGLFRERIAPGAFHRALRDSDVRALVNHDPNYVLGRNKAGTLSLSEDQHGLAVEIEPPDSQWSRDLMVSMKRGDINQMSFGFRPVKWTEDVPEKAGDPLEVTLREVLLFDVSVVTFPAYPQTEAWARSAIASIEHYLLATNVTPDNVTATRSEPDPTPWQEEQAEILAWQELAND
jgi:Escherichia/Staphylococcus phage prohead protease